MSQLIRSAREVYITVGYTKADFIVPVGSTTANVQIQAAVDLVNALGGGMVLIKRGLYTLSARVVPKINVWICGDAKFAVSITGPSGANVIGDTVSGTTKTVRSNYRISDLTLIGNNRDAVYIHNTSGVTIENCDVSIINESQTWHGINTTYCQDVRIDRNDVHDIVGNGIAVNGCDNFVVSKNIVKACTDDNIDIDYDFRESSPSVPSLYGSVTDNICRGIGETSAVGNGIRVEGSKHVSLSGNYCDDNDGGIIINSTTTFACQYITAANNKIRNCTEWGIRSGAYQITTPDESGTRNNIDISHNLIVDCGTTSHATRPRGGILVWSEHTNVDHNIIDNSGNDEGAGGISAAILLYVKSKNNVRFNHISNSETAIKSWNDGSRTYTTTKVYGNTFDNNATNLDIDEVTSPGM